MKGKGDLVYFLVFLINSYITLSFVWANVQTRYISINDKSTNISQDIS